MLEMKWWLIIGSVGVLLFLWLSKSVRNTFQYLWYGVLYSAVGALILFLLNLVGKNFGVEIAINPITSFLAGYLGLPGIGYLLVVEVFLLQ